METAVYTCNSPLVTDRDAVTAILDQYEFAGDYNEIAVTGDGKLSLYGEQDTFSVCIHIMPENPTEDDRYIERNYEFLKKIQPYLAEELVITEVGIDGGDISFYKTRVPPGDGDILFLDGDALEWRVMDASWDEELEENDESLPDSSIWKDE